jgi:hypothetical protein
MKQARQVIKYNAKKVEDVRISCQTIFALNTGYLDITLPDFYYLKYYKQYTM